MRRHFHLHTDYLGDLYNQNESVQRYVGRLMEEYQELSEKLQQQQQGPSWGLLLSDAERREGLLLSDAERRELHRRHVDLMPLAQAFEEIRGALADLQEVSSLVHDGPKDEDQQMTQLLKDEEEQISNRIEVLKRDLIKVLLPSDPLDSSNVVLEVSAGRTTGGDICQQFTREMFHMYQGFASYKNWTFYLLNYTNAEMGSTPRSDKPLHQPCQRERGTFPKRKDSGPKGGKAARLLLVIGCRAAGSTFWGG
ncbi:hypothetical protein NHX12_009670, partial [Muraenolepis orangiensis]